MPEMLDPADLSADEAWAVVAELETLADDEFVMAERYIDWQVRGPTLEADLAIANIAQDEYGHARLWYDLLEDFGRTEAELIWERPRDEFRHTTLAELAFETGDWADCVLRSYLYDHFERLRLEALEETTYPRIADRVGKVVGEEHYHRDHAENWLERLSDKPRPNEAHTRLQDALDRLYPHALTMFEPTEHEERIVEAGVRPVPLADLREDWLAITTPFLEGLGLTVPAPDLPESGVRGRDGTHTDDWRGLYNEFTYTYEMLDRDPAKLMADPDEAGV
jgi:ring-1,2-phenylacetyl-CoA epoxidase subunit PaaC